MPILPVSLNGTNVGGIKLPMQMSGNFEGFPENNNALFGLVIHHDTCIIYIQNLQNSDSSHIGMFTDGGVWCSMQDDLL